MIFKTRQKGFGPVLAIIVLMITFFLGTGIYLQIKSYQTRDKEESSKKTPTPTEQGSFNTKGSSPTEQTKTPTPKTTTTTKPQTKTVKFPINMTSVKVSSKDYEQETGNPAPCQPELFDPATAKFKKVKTGGTPSELYKIEGTNEGIGMMINGWNKEGEDKVTLPSPFVMTKYTFGCASSFSRVIEIQKNNIRQSLYTHVTGMAVSKDKKYLYLVNNLERADGTWQRLRRIIDIINNKAVTLPNIPCVAIGSWQENSLISYSDLNLDKPRNGNFDDLVKFENNYKTKICIFNLSGQLQKTLEGDFPWGSASADFLDGQIGLLPKDQEIFYAFISTKINESGFECKLFLQDLGAENKTKVVEPPIKGADRCVAQKIDLTNVTFTSPTIDVAK